MDQRVLEYEATLPFCVLALVAGLAAAWESWAPRQSFPASLRTRWVNNAALWLLDAAIVRWAFPTLGVAFALIAARRGWGLFNAVAMPPALTFGVSIVALDLARYGEHWMYHRVAVLWRLHRVHHTDTAYDFTLGLRFHPVEGLATAALILGAVAALGIPAVAVLAYQLLAIAASLLSHANVRIPSRLEAILRRVVVTPDMHRIHHSVSGAEAHGNLGNLFSWWDRIFGTYVAQPAGGHEALVFGVERFRRERDGWLPWMLLNPFARD
jgi:sterol desaturase/sphingolipid hydroxylase (fatty acid hydroxylase superfamily)